MENGTTTITTSTVLKVSILKHYYNNCNFFKHFFSFKYVYSCKHNHLEGGVVKSNFSIKKIKTLCKEKTISKIFK